MTQINIFQRVETSYDLARMRHSRIISVGCGGAASFLENMARCGVGEFVLIDPDLVEEKNIGTQHCYLDDVGRAKVDCIADRIKQINPTAVIEAYQVPLDDIDDVGFADLVSKLLHFPTPLDLAENTPHSTLLLGLTDNFYAQARVSRLSLQFGIPSLCAQLYQYGQAAEITITYPGVTPACHRCMLSPRYRAYLEQGYQNTVTSDGTPIFATERLNALKGDLALAILHHATSHPTWGEMLSRIGNRTLIQIRMHPDAPLKIFNRVFTDTTHCFFDEPVWIAQEPNPWCPECGGTGDLFKAKGKFVDTRQIAADAKDPIPPGVWG